MASIPSLGQNQSSPWVAAFSNCGAGLGPYHLVPGRVGVMIWERGPWGFILHRKSKAKWREDCLKTIALGPPASKEASRPEPSELSEGNKHSRGRREEEKGLILEFLFFLWISFLLCVNFSEAAWSTAKDSVSLGVVQWQHCAWYKDQGLWLLMRLSCTTWLLLLLLAFLFKQEASSPWIRLRFCSPGLFPTLSHCSLCSPFDKIFPTTHPTPPPVNPNFSHKSAILYYGVVFFEACDDENHG
jgi:hypothetical protein